MSAFKAFFGSKKKQDDPQVSKQQIRDTIELLQKKSEFHEKKIEEEIANARRYGVKNKKMALKALRKKKDHENALQKMDNCVVILENQLSALDNAGMNMEVFKALKGAATSLRAQHKNINMDELHNTMDDIMEQQDVAKEISDLISDPSAFNIEYDEDELLNELNDLAAEEFEEKMLDVSGGGGGIELPSVPSGKLPAISKEDESERQLKELEGWAE